MNFFGIRSDQPEIIKQCKCGYKPKSNDLMSKKKCAVNVALVNHLSFPSYELLTKFEHPSPLHYDFNNMKRLKRHWALILNINQNISFMRPGLKGSTQFGENCAVHFYHDKGQEPKTFSWDDIHPGRTIVILYAERKTFLDLSQGVRQEDLDSCFIFKAKLEIVLDEANKLLNSADLDATDEPQECFNCGIKEKDMNRCGKCKLACYCSKECQTRAWTNGHKKLCSQSDVLLRLASMPRHREMEKFYDFNRNSSNYLSPYKYVEKFARKAQILQSEELEEAQTDI